MAGACIGDQRILNDDGTNVTIRIKDYRNDGALDEITMPGVEFVRRFVQHILPANFRRVRYSGLLGQRQRSGNLERCRELLKDRIAPAEEEEPETLIDDQEQQEEEVAAPKSCPRCHSQNLLFIEHYWPEQAGRDEDRWLSASVDSTRQPTQSLLQAVPP